MTFHRKLLGGLLALLVLGQSGLLLAQERPRYALLAGKVLTMNDQDEVLDNVVVLVAGGKIEKIMRRVTVLEHQNQELVKLLDELMEILSDD